MEKPSNTGLFWAALAGLAAAGGVYTWQRLRQFAPARFGMPKTLPTSALQARKRCRLCPQPRLNWKSFHEEHQPPCTAWATISRGDSVESPETVAFGGATALPVARIKLISYWRRAGRGRQQAPRPAAPLFHAEKPHRF